METLLKSGNLSVTTSKFVSELIDTVAPAELPKHLAKMALAMRSLNKRSDAIHLAQVARQLAPNDTHIRVLTEWQVRHQVPLWHFRIIHDRLRNEAYARALRHFVQPDMVVFEIGTGTGILAMLAAQAGARHVYTCERRQDVAEVARDIIQRNGFADRITVVSKDARALQLGVDIPERADLFVAEIIDNMILGEGVLSLTQLAKEKFLKPDAILLPHTVSAMGYLLDSTTAHRERYRMESAMGFDVSPFNRFSPVRVDADEGCGDVSPLSDAGELARFDLRKPTPKNGSNTVSLTANRPGVSESLLSWLRLDFGDGIVFENRPPQQSSWNPQIHVLPAPAELQAGQSINIEISHDGDHLLIVPV